MNTIDTKHTNPCIEKARDDEPLWVARGQDKTAAAVACFWLALNIDAITEKKARAAFENILALKRHHPKKAAD